MSVNIKENTTVDVSNTLYGTSKIFSGEKTEDNLYEDCRDNTYEDIDVTVKETQSKNYKISDVNICFGFLLCLRSN